MLKFGRKNEKVDDLWTLELRAKTASLNLKTESEKNSLVSSGSIFLKATVSGLKMMRRESLLTMYPFSSKSSKAASFT